jgi:hypothetical protein
VRDLQLILQMIMNKLFKLGLGLALLGVGSALVSGCGADNQQKLNPEYEKDIDSSELSLSFEDTLTLRAGEIPQGWEKEKLGAGYYVAFPKSAKKDEKKQLISYKIKQRDYIIWLSVRDMSQEASFAQFKSDKTAYYYAISNNLTDALTLPDTEMETVYKKSYTALQLHEGLESYLKSADSEIYTRCLIIDNNLYTFAFVSWIKPTASLLQLKDRFFASFGKELEIE